MKLRLPPFLRSLRVKLTLAFVLIGLVGSGLVALAIQVQTEQRFNQFVTSRFQTEFAQTLADYYDENGSWDGVETAYYAARTVQPAPAEQNSGPGGAHFEPLTVVDASGKVILGRRDEVGQTIAFNQKNAVPIDSNSGQVIGWFVQTGPDSPFEPGTPEQIFLQNLRRGILINAVVASLLALLIGALLARTIARPVRDLTAATRIVADGSLGYQVDVRTGDELGMLADSFNRMSADLAHSNELRRQMTADIAHDLRTPLSVILGYTEALSDDKLAGTPEVFGVMHDEAQHLQRMIEDLRTLSLADSGELTLMRQPVAPSAMLERAAVAHRPMAKERSIAIETSSAPDLPPVNVDPDRLAQVLSNLVGNALRHTPAGGHIRLGADRDDGRVMLTVRDDGEGIDPADLPYIFERSYRGDKARHTESGESGLGLAIARSLVRAHGGTLVAESVPGKGATFVIRLPVDGEEEES